MTKEKIKTLQKNFNQIVNSNSFDNNLPQEKTSPTKTFKELKAESANEFKKEKFLIEFIFFQEIFWIIIPSLIFLLFIFFNFSFLVSLTIIIAITILFSLFIKKYFKLSKELLINFFLFMFMLVGSVFSLIFLLIQETKFKNEAYDNIMKVLLLNKNLGNEVKKLKEENEKLKKELNQINKNEKTNDNNTKK